MIILNKSSGDLKIINAIKSLGIDMIDKAGSGHPGIVLGAAPIIYTLFSKHLNFNSSDASWANRDRFILSAGHGSALLYATLYMAGYDIKHEDLKNFRQINSILPGHPERNITPGVELTTGPLGQGIATSVGMSFAERYLRELLNQELSKQELINHYTYVLCGDGDLMEGVAYEAISFAGTQKLGKLIVLYDSNNISLDGPTKKTFTENIRQRFQSMGWHTELVKNGNDINAINKAIIKAKNISDAPSLIEVKTVLGYGSVNAGKSNVHGTPLDKEDYSKLRVSLGIKDEPFIVGKDEIIKFREQISKRVKPIYEKWQKNIQNFRSSRSEIVNNILDVFLNNKANINFTPENFQVENNYADDMRTTNNNIMNAIGDSSLFFLGGSADIAKSCQTNQKKTMDNEASTPTGKNIWFGVREHAMGAIMNGIATYGIKVYGSTYLAFSDYHKAAIRMSALMNLPVTYIYTHESIRGGNCPDGVTHLPVEQLAGLRAIPNLTVLRPADINEIIGSWNVILNNSNPSVLLIGKNNQTKLTNSNYKEVVNGAYIIKKELNKLDGIIIATGCEVDTAIKISEELASKYDLRIVSMPSTEIFNSMGKEYQDSIISPNTKIITLEASNDPIWYKYASNKQFVVKLDDFGYSGNADDVLRKMEFDLESLKQKIEMLLNK